MLVPREWRTKGGHGGSGAARRPCSLVRGVRLVKLHCGEPRRRGRGLLTACVLTVPLPFTIAGIVIAHPDPLDHDRPLPLPAQRADACVAAAGDASLIVSASAQRSARPRERWRDYLLQGRVWLAVALLHALFVLGLWQAMRPRVQQAPVVTAQQDALEIRFFSPRSPAAASPPPPALVPPPRLPKVVVHHEPPAPDAMHLQPPPVAAAPSPHLFDAQGRVLLPATSAGTDVPTAGYVANLPQGDAKVMQHDDPVKYESTRFNQYFPPPGESLGQSAVRHVVDKVTGTTAVNLPRGVHLKCQTVLGIPIPNCTMPPAPPSAKDGDERLSMAPAASLDGAPHGRKAPTVQACIEMYRAGKPLAWGCPIDTPNRAVDAELRDRAAGAKRDH